MSTGEKKLTAEEILRMALSGTKSEPLLTVTGRDPQEVKTGWEEQQKL